MKNKILGSSSLSTDLAILFLRMIFGGLFIFHGLQKIDDYDKILPMFKDYIGIGTKLSFNLVIFAEFFCGFLVLIGCFTRLAILPILFTMIVVLFIAIKKESFMLKELPLVFLLLCVPIFIFGGGKYSVDRFIFKKSP